MINRFIPIGGVEGSNPFLMELEQPKLVSADDPLKLKVLFDFDGSITDITWNAFRTVATDITVPNTIDLLDHNKEFNGHTLTVFAKDNAFYRNTYSRIQSRASMILTSIETRLIIGGLDTTKKYSTVILSSRSNDFGEPRIAQFTIRGHTQERDATYNPHTLTWHNTPEPDGTLTITAKAKEEFGYITWLSVTELTT